MVIKQNFPTTRITFSKGKQNLSKLVASLIYYLYNKQNIIISVVQMVKLLIENIWDWPQTKQRNFSSCWISAVIPTRSGMRSAQFFGKLCLLGSKGRSYSELLWPVCSCLLLPAPMGTIRPMTPNRISLCRPVLSRCCLHLCYFFSICRRS